MGVTTTGDEYGEVQDLCSLREMIQAVNNNADYGGCRVGTGAVSLPAGTYTLTRAGANEDNNATGDLDIRASITLNGAGVTATIVNGGGLDRVAPGAHRHCDDQRPEDHRRRGGRHESRAAGCVNAGTLTLIGVTVSGNTAADAGGGISNTGNLTLTGSTIQGNKSGNSGGGISSYRQP